MRIYSDSVRIVWRGESFISKVQNLAPLGLSDIALFSNSYASDKDAAGEEESHAYSSTLPPSVI